MTIGLTFPVRRGEEVFHIPWGTVEAHRAEIQKAHGGKTLERLHALGGIDSAKMSEITGWAPDPKQPSEEEKA